MVTHDDVAQQIYDCYDDVEFFTLPEKTLTLDSSDVETILLKLNTLVGELDSIAHLTPLGNSNIERISRALFAIDDIVACLSWEAIS